MEQVTFDHFFFAEDGILLAELEERDEMLRRQPTIRRSAEFYRTSHATSNALRIIREEQTPLGQKRSSPAGGRPAYPTTPHWCAHILFSESQKQHVVNSLTFVMILNFSFALRTNFHTEGMPLDRSLGGVCGFEDTGRMRTDCFCASAG